MPADYKSRATHKHKNSLPGYVWLLSGLAIGLFVAFIVYLDKQPENTQTFGGAVQHEIEKLKGKTNNTNTKKKKPVAENTAKDKKEQKYNFYTIFTELEILIPESETRPPASKDSIKKNKTNKQFILQVGSFQNLNDAEKLKANLAFLGLEADIQHVTVNQQAWHRVRTGPYKSRKLLYQNQRLLKQNNIPAISMELK